MDNKYLTLIQVVECQSYTKAAVKLHLTQPALTQHIKKLEQEYQCEIFDSTKKGLSLTVQGKMIFDHAKVLTILNNKLDQRLRNTLKPLTFGMTLSISDYYVNPALFVKLYKKEYNCSIEVMNTEKICERLISGSMDCAIVEGLVNPSLFYSHIVHSAKFICVVNHSHPLLHSKNCTFEDLFNYPIVLREKGSGTRGILINLLHDNNYNEDCFIQQIEMGSFRLIKEFVKETHAITFLYENVVKEEIKNGILRVLDIKNGSCVRNMVFIYPKNNFENQEIKKFYNEYVKNEVV